MPWLVWLSGLSAGLKIKGSPVQFPVRVHAWIVGQVPGWGVQEATGGSLTPTSLPSSLPISLKINKQNS